MSYEDVRRHSETILTVTQDKYMPPWKPIHTGIAFANNRQLSTDQIDTLTKWVEADCPEGDRSSAPKPPEYKDGWTLGSPDMVIKMDSPFNSPADGPDIYRSFVLPVNLLEDRWVKAIKLRPMAGWLCTRSRSEPVAWRLGKTATSRQRYHHANAFSPNRKVRDRTIGASSVLH